MRSCEHFPDVFAALSHCWTRRFCAAGVIYHKVAVMLTTPAGLLLLAHNSVHVPSRACMSYLAVAPGSKTNKNVYTKHRTPISPSPAFTGIGRRPGQTFRDLQHTTRQIQASTSLRVRFLRETCLLPSGWGTDSKQLARFPSRDHKARALIFDEP